MLGFYSNLLNNNCVAFGGGVDDSSESSRSGSDDDEGMSCSKPVVTLVDRCSPETAAERAKLKRKRAEETMIQAAILQRERELQEKQKEEELKAEYAKHQTTTDEVAAARERFLARKRAKTETQ